MSVTQRDAARPDARRSLWVAALIGVGIMAAIDEIVFHQVLAWHHFYDRSTTDIGLLSDGLLHTAELAIIVGGFFLYADLRRRDALAPAWAWAGFCIGAGAFQIFDGIVDHKLLRIHQVRYDVDLLPYDIAWNASGLALLLIGLALAARAKRTSRQAAVR